MQGRIQAGGLLAMSAAACAMALGGLIVLALFWWTLPAWLVLELCVWPARFALKYARLNAQPSHHAPPEGYDGEQVFRRLVEQQKSMSKYLDIEPIAKEILQAWFWDVPITSIKRGNVADLLAYGFLYKSREQLEAEGRAGLTEGWVRELEASWGVKLEDGHDPGLPFMAHLWQEIRCSYRPACFYAVLEALNILKHALLWGGGFTRKTHGRIVYYARGLPQSGCKRGRGSSSGRATDRGSKPSSSGSPTAAAGAAAAAAAPSMAGATSTPTPGRSPEGTHPGSEPDWTADAGAGPTPLVFLHGVGVGLLPYFTLLARLAADGNPLLAVESPHLGMRWVETLPDEDMCTSGVLDVMDAEGLSTVSLVAHSYGTFMASRLVQRAPQRLHSLTLIDPVCFLMFSGKLIRNFVYRVDNSPLTTRMVARDIHHAASVSRHFFWSLLNLWPDQLPHRGSRTLVVLSGDDELVPVEQTMTMLKHESEARVVVHDGHLHAGFVKDPAFQDKIAREVLALASLPPAPPDSLLAVASAEMAPCWSGQGGAPANAAGIETATDHGGGAASATGHGSMGSATVLASAAAHVGVHARSPKPKDA